MLVQSFSRSAILTTISNKDIEMTENCMNNIDLCIPETIDCSNKFYCTSKNLLKSINELLSMVNPDYSENIDSFKQFPGIQSGALIQKASSTYAFNPDPGRYHTTYMS